MLTHMAQKLSSIFITSVSISEYQYDRIRRIEQYLTYEYALNVFSDYISKNEEYTSITFTEISFEYGMRRTGKRGSLLLFRFRYLELKITIMG